MMIIALFDAWHGWTCQRVESVVVQEGVLMMMLVVLSAVVSWFLVVSVGEVQCWV